MRKAADAHDRNQRRQFSLRALFRVTLAAAILVGVAVVFRDSGRVRALWSPHALLAALPILGIFVIHATAVINRRRLAVASLAIYCVALATPALRLTNTNHPMFGYFAFLLSFVGIGLFFGGAGLINDRFWFPIACTMGALANISFILGYVSFLRFVIWRRGNYWTRWSATLASCLSLSVILPLAQSKNLSGVYLGYGLWVTSLLALAFGGQPFQSDAATDENPK